MPVDKKTHKQAPTRKVKPRSNTNQKRGRPSLKKPSLVFTRNKGPLDFTNDKRDACPTASKNRASSKAGTSPESCSLESRTELRALSPHRSSFSTSTNISVTPLPRTLPNSSLLEHIATSRFFHHYLSPKRTFVRLDLDFTTSVIENATKRSTLAEVVIALGILTLPNKTHASRVAAQCRYARALRLTNKALADKEHAKSDEVLMAVILLGFYETTPDEAHSMTSWTSHLNGARHLLCIRGREMLKSGTTYRLFSLLRSHILLHSFMMRQSVPADFVDLSNSISETQDGEERAASELVALFARMCNLNASAQDAASTNPAQTIAEAIALDHDLTCWASGVPPELELSVEPAGPASKSYADYYETYCSIFSAEIWMLYRTARVGVNGLIVSLYGAVLASQALQHYQNPEDTGSPYDEESGRIAPQMQERLDTIEALRIDMCATVPFLLERHEAQPSTMANLPLCNRTPAINLLLPFTKTPGVSEQMYSWASGLLAELQEDPDVDDGAIWMNSSHKGKSISV